MVVGRFSRRQRDEDQLLTPLPLVPGPVSNGEFVPARPSSFDRATEKVLRTELSDAAKKVGMSRRSFVQTSAAVAASLGVFELVGCSNPGVGGHLGQKGAQRSGGTFSVPPPTDVEACASALNGTGQFIFDVHTHHVIPQGPWIQNAPETVDLVLGMLPPGCADPQQLDCVDRANYLHDLFLASDTTVAMLSDVPNSGAGTAPVPFPSALSTQQLAAQLTTGGATRLLVENIVAPNVGPVGSWLDEMTTANESGHLAAFKVYTAWGPNGQGYSLLDPAIGLPTVQHAHDLGVKVFVAHKGLPLVNFDPTFNGPDDLVAVSRMFPDMNFVVYHAAWDPSRVEGPYDPTATVGIDTLLSALDRHGVPANDNVWVDIATVWRQLLTQPDQAAHALGKLLRRVGPQRVMWGTDAIWYGSPQPQIEAFRAFQISTEFQELYGYPALTSALKDQILGLNAAQLFGIDPSTTRCGLSSDPLATGISEAAALRRDGALPSPWTARGPISRRDMLSWLRSSASAWRPM